MRAHCLQLQFSRDQNGIVVLAKRAVWTREVAYPAKKNSSHPVGRTGPYEYRLMGHIMDRKLHKQHRD
jgi:hypothetical protein